MSGDKNLSNSTQGEISEFLNTLAKTPARNNANERGRLIFAMDATASREATWDHACQVQGEMFLQTAGLGGLQIQMCYYRGFAEFAASPWLADSADLLQRMSAVQCAGGHTQIERVLRHALEQLKTQKINALVFVGDCVEEQVDTLCHLAGQIALHNMPIFIFHEGNDPLARSAFQQIAALTKGACCPFDTGSAEQLKSLLSAVAVYAAGGRKALEAYGKRHGGVVLRLSQQLK